MKSRVLFVVLALAACTDPVNSAERNALGPEDPNVPQGEFHRPGQPCLVCHDNFALAGTIYDTDLTTPFEGATITITDAAGNQAQATSNSAGNFIIRKSDFTPVYPIGTYIDSNGNQVVGVQVLGSDPNSTAQMLTQIGREGSCNMCHFGTAAANTPGVVHVTTGGGP